MSPALDAPSGATRVLLLMLVIGNVCMQLAAAWVLKIAPPFAVEHAVAVLLVLGAVLFLNIVRFWLWGVLHRHFPLSVAYPASALLFPGVLAMAWWFGEPIGLPQLLGTALILVGVALLLSEDDELP